MKENYKDKPKNLYVTYGLAIIVMLVVFFGSVLTQRYQDRKHQIENSMSQIGAIYNACKMSSADRDRWPESVEYLEEMGYLTLDDETAQYWDFKVNGTNSITAESTEKYFDGTGSTIIYDIYEGKFSLWQNDELKRELFVR